jgi:CHAT domain-containing protein/tetratricopeptide (TPR) repeat protein
MSKPRHGILLAVLLVTTPAHAAPAPSAEAGWRALDAGENERAERLFARLLDDEEGGPAAARGLVAAWRRDCRLSEGLAAAGWPPARGLDHFARALGEREEHAFSRALATFREAAAAAAAGGDTAGAVAVRLEAADCAIQAGRPGEAADLARAALAAADGPRQRLAAETRLAGAHNVAGRYALADSLYAGIVAGARRAGYRTIACDGLNGRGAVFSRLRRPEMSIGLYEAAMDLARSLGDRPRQARILLNLGYDHTQARDTAAARSRLAAAALLIDACGLEDLRGNLETGLGAAAETDGDREEAIRHFRAGYRRFAAGRDRKNELAARQRLAYNLMVAGHYAEAEEHYETCLTIIDELRTPQILNWVLAGLALVNHRLGNLDRAEDYYLRAIEVNREFGDLMSVTWCRHALGALEVLRGNYRAAVVHNHAALDLARQIGDMESVGEARVALGDLYFRLGDWDRALSEFERAEEVARDNDLEELLRAAAAGQAAVTMAAGLPARARAHYEQALAIARRWQDDTAVIWALNELAELDLDGGDRVAAGRRLAEADRRLEPQGQYLLRSRTRLLQARLATDPAQGVVLAREALEAAETGGLPEQEWACLTELGAIRLAAGDTTGAIAAQEQAIDVVESLRRNVGSDELQQHLLRSALVPYERIVDLLARRGDRASVRRSFAFAERSRSQILAGRLRAAQAGDGAGTISADEREILAAIAFRQQRLQSPDLPDTARAALRRRVSELETAYLLAQLGREDGDGAPAAFAVVHPAIADLVAVPRPGEQVAAYFLGRESSWLFHLVDGEIRTHPLPPRAAIETQVRRYLALRESPQSTRPQVAAAARRLHDLLVAPLALDRRPPAVLIVLPDGLLHRLPFAALADADGPLVRRCAVFTAPSLQVLERLRRRETARRAAAAQPVVPVVALGCSGPGERPRLHPYDGRPIVPLAHADAEARGVAALFPGGIVLEGDEATEEALAAAPLDRTAILHLAAHSDADARDVRRSFVVLNRPRGADGDDGLLQWNEAAALDLGTTLVTLASCRSARGVLAAGEGVTGLTQAFLFAGGTCVLAAQSDVGDVFTRRFMDGFYRRLRAGQTAAEALRQSQLEALAWDTGVGGRWADFVLVGDGAVRLPASVVVRAGPPPAARLVLAGSVLAGLVLLGFGLRRRRVAG